jgi:hypothetical protein
MILIDNELTLLSIGNNLPITYLRFNMLSDESFPFVPITTIDISY